MALWRWLFSYSFWEWGSPTPGRREHSNGCDAAVQRTEHHNDEHRQGFQLGQEELSLAPAVWPGVLRDRDDGHRHGPQRPRPLRGWFLPRLAPAVGRHDRLRHRLDQDGLADD